nr:NADH dehydrogenase subunit 6 [Symmorphus murarius]
MNQSIIFIFKYLLTPLMFLILLTLIFSSNTSPLPMLIYLLIFSICTVLNLSKLFESNLFSYLTFLMMTGGILILFSFFLSLISNSSIFSISSSLKIIFILMLLISFLSLIIMNPKSLIFNYSFNNEYAPFTSQSLTNYYFNINKLYLYPYNLMICTMIWYLLISLIFITKIAFSKNKTMRKSN